MKKLLMCIAVIGLLAACDKDEDRLINPEADFSSYSTCLEAEFTDFVDAELTCDEGAYIRSYTYQNDTVFVLFPGICGADYQAEVINDECTSLGFLHGISGNDDINGERFSLNAVEIETIWAN
ncbi:MAG: hypothetical protein CL663_00890 [Bacteroidetes bacterium]|nr:hypothetical protein [Bacteroidota bacterium]